ncbi:MAG: peptidyl-prolyl cis-trans isomerase [Actinomycetia bacterium]|nr:peptidyl-prolyl cis-trans isomerase [Actinomycetes bacterium]
MSGSRERERRRARERYERQREEQLARRRKIRQRLGIGLAVFCVLGLVGGLTAVFAVGGTPAAATKPKATASASASASATASAAVAEPATHCTYTTSGVAPAAKKVPAPTATPNYKAAYTAAINTNLGPIDMSLLNSKATCTVNSFVHLATADYFNASQCHRMANSTGLYLLQCGDPTAKATTKLTCSTAANAPGTGGPGYEFNSENLPTGASSAGSVTYKAGTVAMANNGTSGSNGSQFFLVFKNSTLGPDYTPFATITSGLDILQKVANAGTSCSYSAGGGVPKEKVIINSVTIKKT